MRVEVRAGPLALRRGQPEDFAALHRIVSFAQVARMVASWPLPPDPERTRQVCSPVATEDGIAGPILLDGTIIGSMGILRQADGQFGMGYMLHPDHWGRGHATRMGRALIAAIFGRYDAQAITAGSFVDNPASSRVLEKLGFVQTGLAPRYSAGRGGEAPCRLWTLTRADWLAAAPFRIETARLVIRPIAPDEIDAFHAIAGQGGIARVMASLPHPMTRAMAADWLAARQWQGGPGFCAGVFAADGRLVGVVGIGGTPVSTMYFYHPDHHGLGYATEAHRALLAFAFDRFDLDRIHAQALEGNQASRKVLRKLGFTQTGRVLFHRKGQLEPDRDVAYCLSRDTFEAMQ